MLKQFESNAYGRILPLLQCYEGQDLYAQGIISGKYDGKVLVDNDQNPTSAFVLKDGWGNLLGNSNNSAFNAALSNGLTQKKLIDENQAAIFIVDPSISWLEQLQALIPHRQPIAEPRKIYAAHEPCPISPNPEDCEICFIDESLPEQIDGKLPGDVQKVLELRHKSTVPDNSAFGFVVKNGRSCIAWAVVDFIVGTEGEIRLVTEQAHRQQGHAARVSGTAINYGLAHGLKRISWNVSDKNIGSIRTAEKLGITLAESSMEYILIFPEVGYFINLGFSHLDNGRYTQALQTTKQMIDSGEQILMQYGYFLAGAARAGLGKNDKALKLLNLAIDNGFSDKGEFQSCHQLTPLHSHAEWDQLINRLT
ncbi:MAG: GNAT family N-acetyltransferase [Chloroflexota bacterium]